MTGDLESMVLSQTVPKFFQGRSMEFNQRPAGLTKEVIVRGVPILVLVDSPRANGDLAKQAGSHEFGKGPIHGRPTHPPLVDQSLQMI